MTATARLSAVAGDDIAIVVHLPSGFAAGRTFSIDLRRRNGTIVLTPTVEVSGDEATIVIPPVNSAALPTGWLYGHFQAGNPTASLFRLDLLIESDLTGVGNTAGPMVAPSPTSTTATVNCVVENTPIEITVFSATTAANAGVGTHAELPDIVTSGHPASAITGLGTAALLNVGTTAGTVAAGDDTRLSDARTPAAHVHTGADISSGTVAPVRLGSGSPSSANFLRGDGTWATPSGGSSVPLGDLRPVWPTVEEGISVFLNGGNAACSLTVASFAGLTLLKACTISGVRIYVGSGGSANAAVRFLIYGAGANGRPGDLIADCGAIPASSAGPKTLMLASSLALPAGLIYVGTVCAAGTTIPANLYGQLSATSGSTVGYRGSGVSDNLQRGGNYYYATTNGDPVASPTWQMESLMGAITANFALIVDSVS